MNREELIQEVQQQKGNYWSAYDQGRLAFLDGRPLSDNPFHAVQPHVTFWDWERGWNDAAGNRDAAQDAIDDAEEHRFQLELEAEETAHLNSLGPIDQ